MDTRQLSTHDIGGLGIFKLIAEGMASSSGAPSSTLAARSSSSSAMSLTGDSRLAHPAPRVRYEFGRLGPDRSTHEARALIRSIMWLRAGFVGASVLAIGVATMAAGNAPLWGALAMVVAGGLLMAYGWRRSWAIVSTL